MQDTARKILTEWGFDLLKREANDVFKDKRQAHGLLVKPPGYSSGGSFLPSRCLHPPNTSQLLSTWSGIHCT